MSSLDDDFGRKGLASQTEAESPGGAPFDEQGLQKALRGNGNKGCAISAAAVIKAVEQHTGDNRLADDLTPLSQIGIQFAGV